MSRRMGGSFANLADLASSGGVRMDLGARTMGPGSSTDEEEEETKNKKLIERILLVGNGLPLRCKSKSDGGWDFEWDEDAILAQAKEGLADETMKVLHVGCLGIEVPKDQQEEIGNELLSRFNCVPVFLNSELKEKFYKGCCKQLLWPLLHYQVPLSPTSSSRFDLSLWQAYIAANKKFAEKVTEFFDPERDYVWLHDYHLLILPSFLRKRFHHIRCGFFLHSPFPSSEIFRIFPMRDEILRSLLNCDVVGFHTFDYARHFLSCCQRMLGLEFQSKRGSIAIDYFGRTVSLKIMPTGVKVERLTGGFEWSETIWRRGEILHEFEGKTVMVGVDDIDPFKGIELKLQAYQLLLKLHKEWRGKVVLVQIANPARSTSKDIFELQNTIHDLVDNINREYGLEGYQPVVLIERSVPLHERIAFYSCADCAVVTATRDGMNLMPYEYVACREAAPAEGKGEYSKQSMLIVSEFVGCSPSLSGAIRVNPWNVAHIADAYYQAITMSLPERAIRHEKHWRYVQHHTAAFWAESFFNELKRVCKINSRLRCYGLGFGLSFRVVALDPDFRKLEISSLVTAYNRSKNRAIMLDYDGTLTPSSSLTTVPNPEITSILAGLCADSSNKVFIVSGRPRDELGSWFGANSLGNLGLVAEHGFFYRSAKHGAGWTTHGPQYDHGSWQSIVLPILQLYTESTDGSYVQKKESAVVWHYEDADPDFGNWQSKELVDHLESVLVNESVEVVKSQSAVEIKPKGVNKRMAVEMVLAEVGSDLDFVLCMGDDRSDEDMFACVENVSFSPHMPAEVFACTVGQKPSRARFYLNDTNEVLDTLQALSMQSAQNRKS